jgi:hypothetical protein
MLKRLAMAFLFQPSLIFIILKVATSQWVTNPSLPPKLFFYLKEGADSSVVLSPFKFTLRTTKFKYDAYPLQTIRLPCSTTQNLNHAVYSVFTIVDLSLYISMCLNVRDLFVAVFAVFFKLCYTEAHLGF